jgi:transposase
MPFTDFQCKRIVSLSEGSVLRTAAEIRRILLAEGVSTTHTTVQRTLSRYWETGLFQDRKKSGRPKTVPQHHYEYIDELMAADDELTASDLYEKLKEKYHEEVCYSKRTASRAR